MNEAIRKQLSQWAEPEYRAFSGRLLPDVTSIMGVRLPNLRKLAKQIVKEDWEKYLEQAEDTSFEEIMLQGMVIGYANEEMVKLFPYIETFVTKIDNWSVCDSFCSGLKITKTDPERMWEFLQNYLYHSEE